MSKVNIVEELRDEADAAVGSSRICTDAASELERLRGEVVLGRTARHSLHKEIDRLREALGRIRYCKPSRSIQYCREIAIAALEECGKKGQR